MENVKHSDQVLAFWFEELTPQQWWVKDDALDQQIKASFLATHQAASKGELYPWRVDALGRLAEIIVLDQFSRNIYRNQPESFAQDPMALVLAQEAISLGIDQQLTDQQRGFLYLPFMHSESLAIHHIAEQLYRDHLPSNLDFELKHKVIIERFGRYPHRNEILNRTSSQAEIDFLKEPNSSF